MTYIYLYSLTMTSDVLSVKTHTLNLPLLLLLVGTVQHSWWRETNQDLVCAIRAVYWRFNFGIRFLKVIGSSMLTVDSGNLFQCFRVLNKNEYFLDVDSSMKDLLCLPQLDVMMELNVAF